MPTSTSIRPILHDEVQRLLDTFAETLKVRIVFYDPDGEIIKTDHCRQNSEYCQIMQNDIFGSARCIEIDTAMQRKCLEEGSLVCYQCHAGLKEAVAPVMIQGKLAGFVLIGQFRNDPAAPENVLKRGKKAGISSKQIVQAYEGLPHIDSGQLDNVLSMFMILVDYIVAKEFVNLRRDWLFERFEEYLDNHFTEDIRIEDVARYAGRSVSSLSHQLRKRYNRTFKQILIEKRLKLADKLLREEPDLPINEIATQVGFEDKCYFSRVYRKNRQTTPSQYRNQFQVPGKVSPDACG